MKGSVLVVVAVLQLVAGAPNYEYDVYDIVTTETEATTTEDPVTEAAQQIDYDDAFERNRELALNFLLDKVRRALGRKFVERLPPPPTNATLTPINTTFTMLSTEFCPEYYTRCSSQTFYPSCELPRNTDRNMWEQRFTHFFNISSEIATINHQDVLNATLRLYKNFSLPLKTSIMLTVRLHAFTRSLKRNRERSRFISQTKVSSDFVGWVFLDVYKLIKRLKGTSNHGIKITIHNENNAPWNYPDLFVKMNCSASNESLVPLPFEVTQLGEDTQRYPALNIRSGTHESEEDLNYPDFYNSNNIYNTSPNNNDRANIIPQVGRSPNRVRQNRKNKHSNDREHTIHGQTEFRNNPAHHNQRPHNTDSMNYDIVNFDIESPNYIEGDIIHHHNTNNRYQKSSEKHESPNVFSTLYPRKGKRPSNRHRDEAHQVGGGPINEDFGAELYPEYEYEAHHPTELSIGSEDIQEHVTMPNYLDYNNDFDGLEYLNNSDVYSEYPDNHRTSHNRIHEVREEPRKLRHVGRHYRRHHSRHHNHKHFTRQRHSHTYRHRFHHQQHNEELKKPKHEIDSETS